MQETGLPKFWPTTSMETPAKKLPVLFPPPKIYRNLPISFPGAMQGMFRAAGMRTQDSFSALSKGMLQIQDPVQMAGGRYPVAPPSSNFSQATPNANLPPFIKNSLIAIAQMPLMKLIAKLRQDASQNIPAPQMVSSSYPPRAAESCTVAPGATFEDTDSAAKSQRPIPRIRA